MLPRAVCECGGSVRIPFTIVRPYQRLWDDVITQIRRWADLGVSLRQMQTEIAAQSRTQVGLRKLNEVVQDVARPSTLNLTSVPPIIMLDAIWVTLLAETVACQSYVISPFSSCWRISFDGGFDSFRCSYFESQMAYLIFNRNGYITQKHILMSRAIIKSAW